MTELKKFLKDVFTFEYIEVSIIFFLAVAQFIVFLAMLYNLIFS